MLIPVAKKYQHMITDMYIRGVTLKAYKDRLHPRDGSVPVFHREMFMLKLGLDCKITDPSQTYIELPDAYKIYKDTMEKANAEKTSSPTRKYQPTNRAALPQPN